MEPVPDVELGPRETLAQMRALLGQGRPFAAHEVLEARWKNCPAGERDLWQGLAQLCVGLTHAARGNSAGASRLLERGAGRLEEHALRGGVTYGLDLTALADAARHHARDGAAG